MTVAIGEFAGCHVLAELREVDAGLLDDLAHLEAALKRALAASGATVLDMTSHRFMPQGVTILALLAESHASLHTYPEHAAVFVDVFTCGAADPRTAVDLLTHELQPGRVTVQVITRGDIPAEATS
ncbi:adenosylmethionine decarboxylase [Herbidospora cretacea]|uniref:adenosylmethionine decarboxylase n=1 Tax=Herbidospora cretacea TaxID=28444 RepID=UPI000772EC36|nr:adenosylmethionine decarboxylase [Herbidospora cretacea]